MTIHDSAVGRLY